MRAQKILKNLAIIFLIVCAIFLAIDIFKTLKININFMNMQSSERISSSSNAPEVRYQPTTYTISNKEDALEEVKKITLELKNEYINSNSKQNLFEIANIHKIKNLFYNYEKYTVVKYKLLNIVEDLPKLCKATNGYSNAELENYFNQNGMHIENYYGITDSSDFIELAKSLSSSEISSATLETSTISFDYDKDTLTFKIKLDSSNGNSKVYFVKSDYYKSNNNQIAPYISFTVSD